MVLTALAEHLDVYRRLLGAYIRSEMQYRTSFVLLVMGSFLANIVDFAGVAVVLSRVPTLAGWSLGEVALLFGMSAMCFSLAEMFAGSLDFFDRFIQAGTFDRLLVRPRGLLVQVMAEEFSLRRLGRFAQGFAVFLIASRLLAVRWTPDKVVVLGAGVASGVAIFFSIFVLGAVFCFWMVQAREATNVFTYGGDFTSSYPLDVYRGWLRRFVTFVVPLAFVNYYPALYVLDRADPLGLPGWVRLLSPAVALLLGIIAWRAWAFGVRHYQSTGT
jgi:ABC-2 type transport system permease protein